MVRQIVLRIDPNPYVEMESVRHFFGLFGPISFIAEQLDEKRSYYVLKFKRAITAENVLRIKDYRSQTIGTSFSVSHADESFQVDNILFSLKREILVKILAQVPTRNLLAVGIEDCRFVAAVKEIIQTRAVIDVDSFDFDAREVRNILKRFGDLAALDHTVLAQMLAELPTHDVLALGISDARLTAAAREIIQTRGVIEIDQFDFSPEETDQILQEFVTVAHTLKLSTVFGSIVGYAWQWMPRMTNLEHLSLEDFPRAVQLPQFTLANLESVSLHECHQSLIDSLISSCPRLNKLRIGLYNGMATQTVKQLAATHSQLERIEISHCSFNDETCTYFAALTHLKELTFIHVTQDAADSWYGLAAAIGHQIEKFKIIGMTIDADEQINAISQMKNAKVMYVVITKCFIQISKSYRCIKFAQTLVLGQITSFKPHHLTAICTHI